MFSRTHLLIEKEIERILKEQPWGIEIWPLNDDSLFELVAKIKGLRGSPWENGIFKLYIKFDEHYNIRPPNIYFQTIPFHPNVDVDSGRPCVDFLDNFEEWNRDFTLSSILLTLQVLLSNPVLKNAVNMDAVQMIRSSPQSFHQMIKECVNASCRVEAGESPQIKMADSKVRFEGNSRERQTGGTAHSNSAPFSVAKLSFDDYHSTWCGIATSKTKVGDKNPLLEAIKNKANLQEIHLGLPREEVEEQMRKQMEDHKVLMYGRIKTNPGQETARQARLAQLERMKKIYLPPRQSPFPPSQDNINLENTMQGLQDAEDNKDGWEREVDDLVNWTNNLDSNAIDAT